MEFQKYGMKSCMSYLQVLSLNFQLLPCDINSRNRRLYKEKADKHASTHARSRNILCSMQHAPYASQHDAYSSRPRPVQYSVVQTVCM